MQFPRNDGLLFNHVWGKSLRDGSANLFGICRHSDLSLCPVKAIQRHIAISSAVSLNLLSGTLFRPLNSSGKIQNKQIANSLCSRNLAQLSTVEKYLQWGNSASLQNRHGHRYPFSPFGQLACRHHGTCWMVPRSHSISLFESCVGFTSRRSFRGSISSRLFCPSSGRLLH